MTSTACPLSLKPLKDWTIRSTSPPTSVLKPLLALVCLLFLLGCEESPDEARFKLGQLGYQFNPFSLLLAVKENDHVAVKFLISGGDGPGHGSGPQRRQCGARAIGYRRPGGVERFGKTWCSYDRTCDCGSTRSHGNREVLIDAGADPNKPDSEGMSALMRAVEGGHTETVEALVDADADADGEDGDDTPLMLAAVNNDIDMVELLLDIGVEVSVRNEVGLTALIQAASEGGVEVAAILIDAGAGVDARHDEGSGDTALIRAVKGRHVDAVRLLLDEDADPNLQNNRGITALMAAIGYYAEVRLEMIGCCSTRGPIRICRTAKGPRR